MQAFATAWLIVAIVVGATVGIGAGLGVWMKRGRKKPPSNE